MLKRNIDRLGLERLREVLDYDPATGRLSWRVRLGPMSKLDRPAGKISVDGYRKVTIDGLSFPASHLAWLHFYGVRPAAILDHKNGVRADDRIENLREASHSQNSQNIGSRRGSRSGLKGASRASRGQPGYRSTITVNGNRIYLGSFATAEDAHAAYAAAAADLHGEFARTKPDPKRGIDMTTRPLRVQIKAMRDTMTTADPRHRNCSNIDQLLTTMDTTMHWPAQEFYIGKMLKVNADALAYREAKGG